MSNKLMYGSISTAFAIFAMQRAVTNTAQCGAKGSPEYSRLIGGGRRCGLSAMEAMEDATEGGPLDGAPQGVALPNDWDR